MSVPVRRACFLFFFASGFCGLLYEVVWTRLAMAAFGVTTTVVSVVVAVFMAGLALGAWIAGLAWLHRWLASGRRFLRAYAIVELSIGSGAFIVPRAFDASRAWLLQLGASDSASYHLWSSVLLAACVIPWATLMGTTFALGIAAMRAEDTADEREFSYLYLANVLGAAVGTLVTALVLIELLGFRRTLVVAAAVNAAVFAAAWWLSFVWQPGVARRADSTEGARRDRTLEAAKSVQLDTGVGSGGAAMLVLAATGFVSMGLELVWTRTFARFLGTFVYAFAAILVSYLLATFMGSRRYRIEASRRSPSRAVGLWTVLTLLSLFPLALIDERSLRIGWIVRATLLVLSIVPFCAALGYLTPLVIDAYAGGSARRASRAYAANVIGCILGPLCAGWILLPTLGERGASAALALVLLAIGAWAAARAAHDRSALTRFSICAAIAAAVALGTRTYAETVNGGVVMHDETATVVASGSGMAKELTVNGVGMTGLTTITKVMAHLPMAQLDRPPRAVLDICFGMGTTFRSLAAWDVDVTAVDLVPSVPAEFAYFHADADAVRRRPHTRIVVDDGRRFLDRTRAQYDVVTIDPPPPLPAAGSSLLYSREMYEAARHRLVPGGILHQWSPVMERSVVSSITQALAGEFRYLRVFVSIDGWGYHFLASDAPIPRLSARDLTQRLSEAARRDLVEWKPDQSPESLFALLLSREVDPATLVRPELRLGPVTDDHPTNEYFLVRTLRRLGSRPVQ